MFVLSLLTVSPAVFAGVDDHDTSDNYDITNIGIEGQSYTNIVYVERGDTISVEVYFVGTGETTDVNIKTWLGGYEYDNVQASSEMFDVEDGVSYKKTLQLELPDDLIAEQDYTVYVELYDDVESEQWSSTVRVSKERHLLSIQDVIVEDAEAGDYTSVTVRLENMGDKKEEDVKVTVSVPELGIEKSTYLDELTNEEIDNEDEEDSGDVTLTFQIPADAETGDYTVEVDVTYNKGYDTVESSTTMSVEALEVAEEAEDSAVTVVVAEDTSDEAEEDTDFSTALKLGFGILAVLIVILALILIVRR